MKRLALLLLLSAAAISAAGAALPRVLVIGDDAAYRAAIQSAATELKGKADVVRAVPPASGVLHTGITPAELDAMIGDGKWDLIHFNFGRGDLLHRVPGMESIRSLPAGAGGVRVTPPAEYGANLRRIVARLRETGAKLVWANTAPITDSANGLFEVGSEVEYNAIAAKVMAEHEIPTNDINAYVKRVSELPKPAQRGPDPRKSLHPPLVEAIIRNLNLR